MIDIGTATAHHDLKVARNLTLLGLPPANSPAERSLHAATRRAIRARRFQRGAGACAPL